MKNLKKVKSILYYIMPGLIIIAYSEIISLIILANDQPNYFILCNDSQVLIQHQQLPYSGSAYRLHR